MKKNVLLLLTTSFSLLMMGCQPKTTTTSSNNSNTSPYQCHGNNWFQPGCPGHGTNNGTTTGGTDGGTTGSTTGGTTSGSTTGSGHNFTSIPSDNNWQSLYPHGVPPESCASPTGSGYDLRKGTITIAGRTWYHPALSWTTVGEPEYRSISYTHNNSFFLTDPAQAKQFFDTDSKLRVRLKVRPQPKPPTGKSWCYNRVTGMSADTYGYTVLKFNVSLRGLNADGTLKNQQEATKSVTVPVNSCSQTLDFSGDNQRHPHGVVLVVHDVQSDQGCWYSKNCNSFVDVRSASCWQMDFEVSVDGTKDI